MLAVVACSASPGSADDRAPDPSCVSLPGVTSYRPSALAVAGEPPGVLARVDPSILWPPGTPSGLLVYSETAAPSSPFTTYVAASNDHGATWQFAAQANAATPITVTTTDPSVCGATSCSAQLSHEVPSIMFDPSDPDPSRRYKLFVHAYPAIANTPYQVEVGLGYIGLETSPDAESWSADTKLLGWDSSATLSSSGALTNLDRAFPELADCGWFTDPGAVLAPSGAIDLVLSCAQFGGLRIVLLRSTDHAQTFRYVSQLLSIDDAQCLGSTTGALIGGDLFYVAGQEYLAATPMGGGPGLDGLGLFAFPFADPEAGTLRRDDQGKLIVTRDIVGAEGTKIITGSYAEGASAAGYVGFYTPSDGGAPQLFASAITAP